MKIICHTAYQQAHERTFCALRRHSKQQRYDHGWRV